MKNSKKFSRGMLLLFLIAALCSVMAVPFLAPVQAAPVQQAATAELSLTLVVNNPTPNRNDPVIFTITVNNAGPDVATGVSVSDMLPAGLVYASDSGGGTYNNGTGIWTVGAVPVGGSVALNIITNATTTGMKRNTASILSSDQVDSPTGNTASVDVTPRSSDVSITMSVNNPSPSVGDIVIITIVAINSGPDNATGVRVTDLLPAGLSFISFTSSSSPSGSGGTYTSSTGNWSVGTLNVGITKTLNITASVTSSGARTNYAEVTESDQLDPDSSPANGSTTEDDNASVVLNAPTANLALSMSVNNTTPNKTEDVIFTITVTNAGPNNATGVTVRDILPAGLTYVSDDGAGTYNSTTGIWSVGSLLSSGVGSSDVLTITTRATTTGTKINIAEVWTSNQSDTNSTPGNGVSVEDDYDSTTVTPRAADLSITKTVDVSAPASGDPVVFTITVRNDGPDGATGVTVLDLLPAGYSYSSDDGGGAYNSASGVWTVGNLPVSTNRVLRITATTTANPNRTNSTEVRTSDQLDTDSTPGNSSSAEDDDDAAPKVDLSLTKTVNNALPSLGTNIVFTLTVRNSGPGNASGVTVRDILPSGLVYVSDNGAGAYNNLSGIWNVGTLANGATRVLSITTRANAIGVSINSAEIWTSDQFDVDSIPGNGSTNTDDDESVSITVSYPAMSLLINEVSWMGTSASTSDEWIELYNPSSSPISLSGWVLKAVDGTPTINLLSGFTLNPGQYFLLERTDDTTVSDIVANQIFTGELGNSSETLQLLDPLNRVIDTANSNGGAWPAGSTSIFGSMERRGVMTDSDTAWITNTGVVRWGLDAGIPNDCTITPPCLTLPRAINGTPGRANWAISVTPTSSPIGGSSVVSTPTRTPVPPPPPELVAINEFVPRPGHDWNNDGAVNTGDEFIEIINHGTINVNLSGYTLDDEVNLGSSPYTLPSVTLEPGERIVFYGSQTNILLSDGGDGVRLLKPNGELVDAFNYTVVDHPDQSFCRLPDNGGLDDWNRNCFPTPGLRNSLGGNAPSPVGGENQPSCPIADTLPLDFFLAECDPFGHNIWNRPYWDDLGWYGERDLPESPGKSDIFVD